MNSRILVLGRNGQVGRCLTLLLGDKALAAGRQEVDLSRAPLAVQLDTFVGSQPVSAVINAAAYTKVDVAETEGRQEAFAVNAQAVDELAAWCKKRDIPLVHFSTDYVYDGSGSQPREETAPAAPLGVYGQSKLDGEQAVIAYGGKYLIFRTSWVYDSEGRNFFLTILRLLKEREALSIVDDQAGAPTYAMHLAKATIEALLRAMQMPQFPSGVYHLCNSGQTSWCGFAEAIFMLARQAESREYKDASHEAQKIICQQIKPIPTSAYPTPARRPLNSRLSTQKVKDILGVSMPSWEQGLQECFETLYGSKKLQTTGAENSPA